MTLWGLNILGMLLQALAAQDYAAQYQIETPLAHKIVVAADKHAVPRDLAFALIRVESNFKPRVRSKSGALGLTQLMPATARYLKPGVTTRQVLQVDTNLDLGLRYFKQMLDRYQNPTMALAAYNRGPGYVDRAPEWQYVRDVLSFAVNTPVNTR